MSDAGWVVLARLVRPQGRNGELLAEILTDFPERFADRKRLFLAKAAGAGAGAPREVQLEDFWLHKGRIVFKFATIDSIEAAESLRGLDVVIPREERAPLDEDAVYIDDLVGCRVFDLHDNANATDVGEVIEVDRESTSTALLVVRAKSRGEVLIPFVKAFLRRVDLAEKRIEMELPAGLLEVNAPPSAEEKAAAKLAEHEGD